MHMRTTIVLKEEHKDLRSQLTVLVIGKPNLRTTWCQESERRNSVRSIQIDDDDVSIQP